MTGKKTGRTAAAAGGSTHEIDILHGPILANYIKFIIPLALGNILQLLFNAADIIVVGRFAGAASLAAVGSTVAIVSLYINIYIGLSTGVNIEMARAYATGNHKKVSNIVHASIGLSLLSGLVFLIIGLVTVRPVLRLTGTPQDITDLAALYLYIWCIGMPASVLFNFAAAILRSIGDTQRPMYYLVASGIVNFILNVISVVIFHMGVAGVAIATVVSNYISAFLVTAALLREDSSLKLDLRKINLDRGVVEDIMKYGAPIAVQNSFYTIPNMMIQTAVNSFGSLYVAGNAAAQSIEGFQIAFLSANGIATATFVSQFVSARKYARADEAFRKITIATVITSLSIGLIFMLLRYPLLGLYNEDPEVIAIGIRRLRIMVMMDFMDCTMCNLSNVSRGYGRSFAPTVITLIFVCGFRMIWLLVLFPFFRSYEFILLAWPVSWVLSIIAQTIYYRHIRVQYPREDLPDAADAASAVS